MILRVLIMLQLPERLPPLSTLLAVAARPAFGCDCAQTPSVIHFSQTFTMSRSNNINALRAQGPHRGLSRVQAAIYVGVSASKFDELVKDGRMPKPKKSDARKIFDLRELDLAFDELEGETDANEWDAS